MKKSKLVLILTALLSCTAIPTSVMAENHVQPTMEKSNMSEATKDLHEIYLAGGCFWGIEAYMERIYGVEDAVSGYANGKGDKTSYQMIGITDHADTVKVTYDRNKISLDKLLKYYFQVIDPTSVNKQGNDRGRQYRTGIYYQDAADKPLIEKEIATLQEKNKNKIKIQQYQSDTHDYRFDP